MWWLVLLIGCLIIGCFGLYYGDIDGVGTCITLLCGALFIVWVMGICSQETVREYEEVQHGIQGLENHVSTNSNIRGAFVLGFGYVNGGSTDEMKYYYFKVNDLGKKLESITVNEDSNTYIRETDEMEPCLIYRYAETVNKGFYKWLFGEDKTTRQIAEILVVPSNTIKIEYNVEI